MYKGSRSESYDAKMAKLPLSWGTGNIGSTGGISPTIAGRLKEAQESTLSGGRTRRGTEISSALLPVGGCLMLQSGRSCLSVTKGLKLFVSSVLGGGRGGLSCPN